MTDQVSERFLECYELLKSQGVIKSARQFAISIDVFPQSFNEILKSRRDVTIRILRKFCETYEANPSYILQGAGSPLLSKKSSILHKVEGNAIPVIGAHQLQLYALGGIDMCEPAYWQVPHDWCGKRISLAIQNHRMHLNPSLQRGDLLFCRSIPRDSWQSCIVNNKIYVIVSGTTLYIEKIQSITTEGLRACKDEVGESQFIPWDDLKEVWMPQHKWSSKVEIQQSITQSDIFEKIIEGQSKSIDQLQQTIQQLTGTGGNIPHSDNLSGQKPMVMTEDVLDQIAT